MLGATVALLATGPEALASDASIKAAWDANDAEFTTLGKQQRRAFKAWRSAGFRKSGPVLQSIADTRALLATNTKAVTAEAESSPTGARAKRFVLASNRSFELSQAAAARGVRLTSAGKRAAGTKRLARAQRYLNRSARQARSATKLFRQVL